MLNLMQPRDRVPAPNTTALQFSVSVVDQVMVAVATKEAKNAISVLATEIRAFMVATRHGFDPDIGRYLTIVLGVGRIRDFVSAFDHRTDFLDEVINPWRSWQGTYQTPDENPSEYRRAMTMAKGHCVNA